MTNATPTPNSVAQLEKKIDATFARLERKLDATAERLCKKMDAVAERLCKKLDKRFDALAADIKALKADQKTMKLLLIGIYVAIAALHFAR